LEERLPDEFLRNQKKKKIHREREKSREKIARARNLISKLKRPQLQVSDPDKMLSRFSKTLPRSSLSAFRGMSNFVGGKSWVPSADSKLQKVTTTALVHEVSMKQFASTEKTVPWFLQQMPIAYFRQVPEEARKQHLIAISAIQQLQQGNMSLRIDGKDKEEVSVTIIKTGVIAPGLLLDQLKSVSTPENHYLSGVRIFSSNDNQVALNIYTFNDMKKKLLATEVDAEHILANPKSSGISDLKEHIAKCTPEYVRESELDDFVIEKELYAKVCSNDLSEVIITPSTDGSSAKITIASGNVRPEVLLRLTSAMLAARKIGIEQAHLGTIAAPETSTEEIPGTVTILRLDVDSKSLKTYKDSEIESFRRELKQAKWLDDAAVEMGLVTNPEIGLQKAEIITALCSMLHGPLSKVNPFAFASTKSILETIGRSGHFMSIADSIAQLFKEKFEPSKSKSGKIVSKLSDKEFEARAKDISSKISALQLEPAKLILNKMLEATRLTLRTNLFNSDRYALSLRVHPSLMMAHAQTAPQPFGVFFMHGRWFNGFHCRFRDIARGGLRIVTPQNMDQYALESTRHFDEVYGLSYAQQLKVNNILI
jgi:glutamate dehydrogenase